MMHNIVAITVGDTKGIGIHILLDTFINNKFKKFILFTDVNLVLEHLRKYKLVSKINIINLDKKSSYKDNKINIYNYKSCSVEDNTYKSLKVAYQFCKKKICIGIITLPLRKDKIKLNINKNFKGQTEFFQKIDKKKYSNMILYHKKITISPLTTHISISEISKVISNSNILYHQIYNLYKTLKNDFNLKKPKILISGFNPHAGENGMIGDEEIKYITPTIKKLNKKGMNIVGPLSADSILIKKYLKKFDCFVFMYHDQALIPFKYISQFSGVNYTGNLDVIRTSPDHGTAYDLIGKKGISNKSFLNCYKLILKIYKNRNNNEKT